MLCDDPARAQFPQRVKVFLAFGSKGKACPLSFEKLPEGGSALKAALPNSAPTLEAEIATTNADLRKMRQVIATLAASRAHLILPLAAFCSSLPRPSDCF